MKDYEPISLAKLCNVGIRFHDAAPSPAIGKQTFHGLPFTIGGVRPDKRKCFIGFAGTHKRGRRKAVTVPINDKARHVVIAHTLLESNVLEGEPPSRIIAEYVFAYGDGTEQRVPIRERFEIGILPVGWGMLAFGCVPDQPDTKIDRHVGRFEEAGRRQTEIDQAQPRAYYLWPWKNPRPKKMLASLTIEPADRRFLVAAVTLGRLDEDPICTTAVRDVKLTLPKRTNADKPFDLEVEIDRGLSTYPYPLPEKSAKAFIEDDRKGWGEKKADRASPSYVKVTGTPSATVTVKQGGKSIGKANWGQLTKKNKVTTPRVKFELIDSGTNWVHTRVVDDETGNVIPCRVHFRSTHGVPYQPHGHHSHVNSDMGTWHVDVGGDVRLGQASYAYIDGTCQGWLPRGKAIVDVAKGFEYEPLRQIVDIQPGQRDLELRLKRWCHMNADRWFSGDTHVHFLGTQGAHREAQGEDLNVVNLLASQWGHLFTNTEDFIGRPTSSDDGNTIVYCSQENRQHLLGHLTLLGLKEHVSPWCSDGPGEAETGGNLETTLSRWADACHAQGGTVVIPHLPNPNGEPAALIATGRADAVEMLSQAPYNHLEYYRYLNCGYKLPLVGGTDKMTSDVPVGINRTYVHIPGDEAFDYDVWLKHMRAGRTFLSSGPMIGMTVNGAAIGDTVNLPGNGGTVEVEAWAESIFPIHTLQIVNAGEIIASSDEAKGARRLTLKTQVKIDQHTWLAARCAGPQYASSAYGANPQGGLDVTSQAHHDGWARGIFAHTSPIYVAVNEPWWMFNADTAHYMLTLVDGSLKYIRDRARHHHDQSDVTHHHDHHDHQEFLEAPFQEAAAAIHKRMHQMGVAH